VIKNETIFSTKLKLPIGSFLFCPSRAKRREQCSPFSFASKLIRAIKKMHGSWMDALLGWQYYLANKIERTLKIENFLEEQKWLLQLNLHFADFGPMIWNR
jgi:hypothetical protein